MAVTFTDRGAWDNGTPYTKFDVVHQDGRYYIARVDTPRGVGTGNRKHWCALAMGKTLTGIELREVTQNCERYRLKYSDGSRGHLQVDYSSAIGGDPSQLARYGVSGIGQSANALTRLYDAVGMTAEVGGPGDNSAVVNDFDNAAPFMRRKCVGAWSLAGDRAEFTVNAYYGDEDYTEDGSMGDYVAVECPLCFYSLNGGELVISAHKYEGMRAFDVFCHNHDQNQLIEKYYLPAYGLGMKDGKAVSLPGLECELGNYKDLVDQARTYGEGALGQFAILEPMAVNFYEWALMTVEFADQNVQKFMSGINNMRNSASDRVTFLDGTHVVAQNYYTTRAPGVYVTIIETNKEAMGYQYRATHKILSETKCDSSGTPDASGTCQLLEVEDLGKGYTEYDLTGATEYKIGSREYPTGTCNNVSTPSGNAGTGLPGVFAMKYRWRENVYGNLYSKLMDLFCIKVGTGDDDWCLDWYYLPSPELYEPSADTKPDAEELAAAPFEKLTLRTEHENYGNSGISGKQYDENRPDVWIPGALGGSSSTYFCDSAFVSAAPARRLVHVGGFCTNTNSLGPSFFDARYEPQQRSGMFSGILCFVQ